MKSSLVLNQWNYSNKYCEWIGEQLFSAIWIVEFRIILIYQLCGIEFDLFTFCESKTSEYLGTIPHMHYIHISYYIQPTL